MSQNVEGRKINFRVKKQGGVELRGEVPREELGETGQD